MNLLAGVDLSTSRGQQTAFVFLAALAAGVGAVLSAGQPTGLSWWDSILKFVLAVVVVLAASKAPRWATIVLAAVGAAAAGLTAWVLVAWVGLLLALASALLVRRSRALGALAAALAVQVLLRLPAFGFHGLASIIAGLAFAVVLVLGYRYATKRARAQTRIAVLVIVLLTLVALFVGGLSLLGARSSVERGVSAAQRGLTAARAGDTTAVASELAVAEEALIDAEQRASGVSAQLLRFVPVAAQHQDAVQVATGHGAVIAREAAGMSRDANLDTISLQAGSVDLAALEAMGPQLRSVVAALEHGSVEIGQARSDWLLPGVRARIDELLVEVDELLPEARTAADAVEIVPGLLGADGPRSYFVFFGTPAESREFGGFVGSWALLDVRGGNVSLADSGRIHKLYSVAAANSVSEGIAPQWMLDMGRPTEFPQNLTSSPDFATIAAVSQDVLAGAFDRPVDGYIYLDPWALVDMLKLTGPVEVEFRDQPLTAENAPEFFFDGQYRIESSERTELFDGLALSAEAVLGRLSELDLPGPEELGRVLGPAARAGRIQVVTFDDEANEFLESVKLLRPFGLGETQDLVALVQANATASKLDLYLQRDVNYEVAVNADGTVESRVRVDLSAPVPADAPEFTLGTSTDGGTNRVLLSLYTPLAARDVRLDGEPVTVSATTEFGLNRYLIDAPVPPTGQAVRVEFEIAGRIDPDQPYTLELWHQPLVNTDLVTVNYTGPDGGFTWSGDLVENVVLDAEDLAG